MENVHPKTKSPIETLPPPEKVQERLSQNIRENRLLRQLLKLSRAAQQNGNLPPKEAAHA